MKRNILPWVFAAAALACVVIIAWPEPAVRHEAGILCPAEPVQEPPTGRRPFVHDGYRITPLASYRLQALVLARKEYGDEASELSPMDLALGWGAMSNQAVIDLLDIRQSNRFYMWGARRLPISALEISSHSANVHIIPANDRVRDELGRVVRGSVVAMNGCLVEVTGPRGFRWRSSLRRDDTGNGSCELFFVESLRVTD
ncbi:MAG: hypothetical protein QHI48_05775 [Bacteroidota bacterium]|nr:hypothetical protein [Bacteroidota bacterium]